MRCPSCDDVILDGRTHCECGWRDLKAASKTAGDRNAGRYCVECGSVAWIEQGGLKYCGPCHKDSRKSECADEAGRDAVKKILGLLQSKGGIKRMP